MAAGTPGTEKTIRIGVPDAIKQLESGQPILVLDARSPRAWEDATLKIQGAIRASPQDFEQLGQDCPRDRFTLVYCTCPNEVSSARMAHQLRQQGVPEAYALAGGFDAWRAAAGPVEPKEDTYSDPRAPACEIEPKARAGG